MQLKTACAGSWQRPRVTISSKLIFWWTIIQSYMNGIRWRTMTRNRKKCWVELLCQLWFNWLCLPSKNVAKWLDRFMNKDKAGSRLKGRNWPFTSSTHYDSPLFHSLKSETGIHSVGSVDFGHLQWWTTVVKKLPAAVSHAVDFCHLEWGRGEAANHQKQT